MIRRGTKVAKSRGIKAASTKSINAILQEHGYDVALRQAKKALRVEVYGMTAIFRRDGSVLVRARR